jgi:hypothetical protein
MICHHQRNQKEDNRSKYKINDASCIIKKKGVENEVIKSHKINDPRERIYENIIRKEIEIKLRLPLESGGNMIPPEGCKLPPEYVVSYSI